MKETRETVCPHCASLAVLPINRVFADTAMIRGEEYRCRGCSKEFFAAPLSR